MGKINRKPVAQAGGVTDVYLKTDPGAGFTPADRIVGDSGNFRTVGPILGATSGDRVFKRIRIPLRPFPADSVAIGKTLFLVVIDAATGLVVERPTVKIAAGMTEAVFERPFTIPAGRQYAYAYGIEEGEWNSYLFLFYGHGSPYTTPYNTVMSLYSDGVPPQVGQGWNVPSQTGKHRPIICEADGVVKNVRGPLDPSDFPVVTALDQLLLGQTALLDNGTDPPRLVRKRLDGSVPPFILRQSPSALADLLARAVAGEQVQVEGLGDSTWYSQDTTATGTTEPYTPDGDSRGAPSQRRSSIPLMETLILRLAALGVTATKFLRAWPGDRSSDAVTYHLQPLAGTQLSLIQLLLNDVANYAGYPNGVLSAEQTRANLVRLIEARLRAGVVVVLCLPVLPADAATARKVRVRAGVIRELAAEYGLPVWDWDALTAGIRNRTVDGVHHSPALNDALATALAGLLVGQPAPGLAYSPGTVIQSTRIAGPYDRPTGSEWVGVVDQSVRVRMGQALIADLLLPADGACGIALVSRDDPSSVYVFGDGYWLRRSGANLQLLRLINAGGFDSLGSASVFGSGDWRGMLRLEVVPSGTGYKLRAVVDGVEAFVTAELTEWATYTPGLVSGGRMYVGGLSVIG